MKLSVLIPCYNRKNTIARCILSASAYPFSDMEIIVSDNCSTDETMEIVRGLAAHDKRIVILEGSENVGAIPNWKKCLDHARGDYIHWLWSDDWVEPGFYEKALSLIVNEGADAVLSAVYIDSVERPDKSFVGYSKNMYEDTGRMAASRIICFWHSPQSPAAGLLRADMVRLHFHTNIGWMGARNVDKYGFGTDSLILIGGVYLLGKVSYINIPMVHFTDSLDSISRKAGGMHVIRRRYIAAHLWFMSKYDFAPSAEAIGRLMIQALAARYWVGFLSVPLVVIKSKFRKAF